MLIFSYVLTASLEGALTYMIYAASGKVPLLYALLFFSSIISIPIETSEAGEALRKKAKESGQKQKALRHFEVQNNAYRHPARCTHARAF